MPRARRKPTDRRTQTPRGFLRKVTGRVLDRQTRKATCTLECGHIIVRSIGYRADRSFCEECSKAK